MKTRTSLLSLLVVFALTSCANIYKFPVSNVTPAANIEYRQQRDKNGNNQITIKAENLAAVERLSPPKAVYVVWILTENSDTRNLGQLRNKNAQLAEIQTLTPYKYTDIFITAEEQADVLYPTGVEISRLKF